MMEEEQYLQAESGNIQVLKSGGSTKRIRMDGPDGGWAWLVALAACMINFIMAGLGRMSGILFVAFIEIFQVDRKSASMPFSVRSSGRNLFGPVVGILGQKYGARKVIVTGGIIGSVSAAACFFAPDILWITVLWGGVNGLGTALTVTLPQFVIGQYFEKHRTTATGMAFSGGCVGSFLFPVLLEYLLHNYGIQGTFLITAGIIMHTIPAALILKKPPWLKNGRQQKETNEKLDPALAQSSVKEPESTYCDMNGQRTGNNSANQCIHERLSIKATVKECLIKEETNNLLDKEKNGGPSVSKCILAKNTHNSKLGLDEYPDMAFLKENSQLVVKILTLKMSEKGQSISTEINQNELSYAVECSVWDEIESFYNSILYSHGKCPFRRNLSPIQSRLYHDDVHSDLRSIYSQQSRSFNLNRGLLESELLKVHSAPDISKMSSGSSKAFVLSKLSEIIDVDEQQIAADFPEDKAKVSKILKELRKLSKLCLCEETQVPNAKEISSTEIYYEVDKDESHSNSFADHIKTAFKLYANPLFLMVCFCRAVHFVTFVTALTTVVDFSMDKGLLEEDGKYAIGAISLGDLIGRLGLGWITDRGFMTLPKYMLVVMVLQGMSSAALPLLYTKGAIFTGLAVFGMLQGSLFVRHPVLISNYMKIHEQSIAMGCGNFFSGILGFALPAYIGYFRDTIGSYDYIFYINGILGACVGLLWVFEPFFVRCVNTKRIVRCVNGKRTIQRIYV